ncbi:hypothetical protein BMF94_5565 [Rhodotorula taiwanensis]|uniref:Uncharacterized protein n=1 Tax=Rhodotorula taiwanensis TaxID=741276 RepID=A0A2S5B390_9BASI|nr:hypothetical protein BMF94_5565 [Rhodotorula taiwanensis]
MSTSSLDCALEALPYEIKLVIIAHLAPTSSSPAASLRSHTYLSGLGRASPALYYDLESVVNSSINITERAQVARLVDLAPERIRHQSLPQLTELRIRGGVDGSKRELLESLRGLPLERLELRTLRLKDCSFAAGDFARVLARPLERLELPHCTGIDARTLADAILVSGVELRHLAIEAPASRSPQASPPSSPTLSARSTTSSPADSLVGTLLPYLEKLTSLRVVGDVLDEVDLAKLARQLPALRSLHLDSNPRLSLSDLVPLLSPTSSTRLPHLSYLHFQPADPASVGDLCLEPPLCLESPAEEQQRNSAIVEDLWRTASETNVELVGLPFREIRDRFDWAAKEVAKVRSCEDSSRSNFGSPARRRKRPSLASAQS